ncbi:MAG: DUF2505 domain-containing protein [Flaviflexus sp.]|nr:DUF2505 domain-containing protein [Flaviflexus sp.]
MHVERSITYPAPPEKVASVLLSEELATARAQEAGADAPEHTRDGNTARTTVEMTDLPSPINKFISKGASATVVQTLRERGEGYSGEVGVETSLPVTVSADLELAPDGAHTRASLTGDLSVNVPFVGKKIEKMVSEKLDDVLARDAELVEGLLS